MPDVKYARGARLKWNWKSILILICLINIGLHIAELK